MKVYKASETEIDQRLALDKRKAKAAFCRGFESDSELPVGFCDLQDKIRDGLEAEFWGKFDDGKERPKVDNYGLPVFHAHFFFPAELISSERIIIELNREILDDKLLGVILAYLEKSAPQYCVIAAVCTGKGMEGINYAGRFVINLEEIAVEESLVEVWSKQVQFMTIE
jgi:hypothetical protein